MSVVMVVLALATQASATAAPAAVVPLVDGGDGKSYCLPDKSLCLAVQLPEGDGVNGHSLVVTRPGTEDPTTPLTSEPLPPATSAGSDRGGMSIWSQAIRLPKSKDDVVNQPTYLIGVLSGYSTMYSGGGGMASRLLLFELATGKPVMLRRQVLDLPFAAELSIRACFSEKETLKRGGGCHDEYAFAATLRVAPVGRGGDLPVLTYSTSATVLSDGTGRFNGSPRGRRRRPVSLAIRERKDPRCSYTRTLTINPASERYEMDRPAPDCLEYTVP